MLLINNAITQTSKLVQIRLLFISNYIKKKLIESKNNFKFCGKALRKQYYKSHININMTMKKNVKRPLRQIKIFFLDSINFFFI